MSTLGEHLGVERWRVRPRRRCGFTLIEALIACGILLGVVISVTAAITAGQQHAYEAQQRIAATLAAEELMGRLITQPYDDLPGWNGYTETVGDMTDMHGDPMADSLNMIGRNVSVTTGLLTLNDLNVRVLGHTIRVRAFNREGRILADLSRYIAEPLL